MDKFVETRTYVTAHVKYIIVITNCNFSVNSKKDNLLKISAFKILSPGADVPSAPL